MRGFVKNMLAIVTLSVLLAGGSFAIAQDMSQTPAPDNTKTNDRDRNPAQATADQQKENRSDRDITRDIRRSIVQDKSLSTYAHNVKVIVQGGTVTLKGPVRSEDESKAIESKALEVAGTGNVKNELSVKGSS